MTIALTHPIPGAPLGDRFGWRAAIPGVIGAGLHNGQDYPVPHGTPVYAAASGTARRGWEAGGFGNFIVIAHGSNFTTWYAHLSSFTVTNGQKVKAGDQIGYVGSTGASTGPHLHWSLRRGGEWLNPLHYIGKATKPPAHPQIENDEDDEMKLWIADVKGTWYLVVPTGAGKPNATILKGDSGMGGGGAAKAGIPVIKLDTTARLRKVANT